MTGPLSRMTSRADKVSMCGHPPKDQDKSGQQVTSDPSDHGDHLSEKVLERR